MNARFLARRTDFELSLSLLAFVVLVALAGLAIDGNWPKVLRVAAAFVGYGSVLSTPGLRRGTPALPVFVLAGAVAGLISGLVRPQPMPHSFVAAQVLASAAFLAPVHWLALRYARRVRARIVA